LGEYKERLQAYVNSSEFELFVRDCYHPKLDHKLSIGDYVEAHRMAGDETMPPSLKSQFFPPNFYFERVESLKKTSHRP
jgi:hypothetical protein